ncbi:MAG: hypothetical protein JSV89_03340 [Spirochaetaceae bacterium]|nr:MAG: hypothetical protein JSV89_03340 [Spirochaetaceae bacterium]
MKKRFYVFVALIVLLLAAPQLFAQYNRDLVVSVMRDNVRLLGEINKALQAEDFYATALSLMELAGGSRTLQQTPPPGGSRAEWNRIHGEMIDAAFRAVGACGAKDAAAVQAEVANLIALRNEGHSKFR